MAWTAPANLELWSGRPDAFGFTASRIDKTTGEVTSATVSLNTGSDLPVGFGDRLSWGGVILHELGHVVGLEHSRDAADLMFPDVSHGPATWSATDCMHLAHVGAQAGCASRTLVAQ